PQAPKLTPKRSPGCAANFGSLTAGRLLFAPPDRLRRDRFALRAGADTILQPSGGPRHGCPSLCPDWICTPFGHVDLGSCDCHKVAEHDCHSRPAGLDPLAAEAAARRNGQTADPAHV